MKRTSQILIVLALSPLAVFGIPGKTRAADPVGGVFVRMTPGVDVGHFDHDQDMEQVAAVNVDYLNSVKSAGFRSIRIFCTPDELVFEMFNEPALSPKLKDDLPGWKNQVTGKLALAADGGKRWNKRVVITEWASQSAPKVRTDYLAYTRFVTRPSEAAPPTTAKPWTLAERNGRTCLLTPAGEPFLLLGLSHASGAWQTNDGRLTPEEKALRLATLQQDLRDLHFNAVGYVPELVSEFAYIHNADRLLGSPGTVTGTGQTVFKNQHLYQDVFDPAFKARLKKQIQDICATTADDANCIGYWWTDIPVWTLDMQKQMFGKTYVDFIRELPESASGRLRYEQYKQESGDDDDGFLVLVARELYTATAEYYRQCAPGKLLFGERYNTISPYAGPLEIIAECGKVVDVVSFQPYEKTLSGEMLDKVHALTGKPIMLSDWNVSFPVGGYTNTMWPQFPNESEAAKAYEAYLTSAFAKSYILGYYKCQYRDAVLASGQLKPGLRDQHGTRYESWAQSIARIHQSLLTSFAEEGRFTRSP